MTRKLEAGQKGPKSGNLKSAVVFLHGYGADGADLLGLADPLAPHLPDTLFLAPDAPEPCAGNPFGRQWFPIPWLDGSSEEAAAEGMARAAVDLNAFLDEVLADNGLTPAQLAVIGFSQGTMMALEVLPRRAEPVAGVVAFSGRLLRPEALAAEAVSKPPVLLVHGDADPVVPFADMGLAGDTLVAAGFETYGHVMQGTGHGIAPDGLSVALQFLKERLPG
ncbi:alpha/beta hydrolase [Pseudothioclava nitratireducens]|uniref:alpha/beta hydrolase n=1 Tax=Pseudothioclava nitratireducens TaxID=1928646 RepID=UPI0023D9CC94|nr:alpha/beta fold hydrolase [Defluviimonas nitratireducens]MDF1619338.1 dienelactone hydrolase family protein [Defluviimonas nitratireducens]